MIWLVGRCSPSSRRGASPGGGAVGGGEFEGVLDDGGGAEGDPAHPGESHVQTLSPEQYPGTQCCVHVPAATEMLYATGSAQLSLHVRRSRRTNQRPDSACVS
jgi:hypothetical protein